MSIFLIEWIVLRLWRWRSGETIRLIDADREERGLTLLRDWLSPDQLRSFDQSAHFDVVGHASSSLYRVHHGTSVNIEEIGSDGRTICAWCFVPEGNLVAGDVMLAQKIALETDEPAALSVAIAYARKPRWMR